MIIDDLDRLTEIHHLGIYTECYEERISKLSKAFRQLINRLDDRKHYLAEIQALESGKPIRYGEIEVERCINQLWQAIVFLNKNLSANKPIPMLKRIPIGLVLAITTFSSPYSSFFHKALPAIICNDTFVFVPSPKVYRCSEVIFSIIESCLKEYFTDEGNRLICVNTKIINPEIVVERLHFDYILFTGKSQTASRIKSKIGYCHGLFETGSCAIAYVDSSVKKLDILAEKLVYASFAQTGMRCIGLKNLFINEKISNILIEKIIEQTNRVKVGNPLDPEVVVGPVLDIFALSELNETVRWLTYSGYRILIGGDIKDNKYMMPTVLLDELGDVSSIKEMYGPILCIHIVKDFREVEEVYYKRSSLNTAFFSKDMDAIRKFIDFCETSGTICINCGPDIRDDRLPFGGLYDENDGKEDLKTLIGELSFEQQVIFKEEYDSD